MFQDRNEARQVSKKYRLFTEHALQLTRELLSVGVLGDPVATLRSGVGLGELSLLGIGNVHRACSAVASEPTVCLMVEPVLYREFLRDEHLRIMNIRDKIGVLMKLFAFDHWQSSSLANLAYKMTEAEYPRGATVIALGEASKSLLVVREGQVTLTHPRGKIALVSLGPGEMIGAEALLWRISSNRKGLPLGSRWSITASSPLKCYVISLDEIARNCSGGDGSKTKLLLQDWLDRQNERRKLHFRRQRRWQATILQSKEEAFRRRKAVQQARLSIGAHTAVDITSETLSSISASPMIMPRSKPTSMAGVPETNRVEEPYLNGVRKAPLPPLISRPSTVSGTLIRSRFAAPASHSFRVNGYLSLAVLGGWNVPTPQGQGTKVHSTCDRVRDTFKVLAVVQKPRTAAVLTKPHRDPNFGIIRRIHGIQLKEREQRQAHKSSESGVIKNSDDASSCSTLTA